MDVIKEFEHEPREKKTSPSVVTTNLKKILNLNSKESLGDGYRPFIQHDQSGYQSGDLNLS